MARFEIQARVLDLLGFQQIANPPTAISELFKNAWDAYAEKASLDVYPAISYAVFWDDGLGMTEEEVLTRWLVVGTAHKRTEAQAQPPRGHPVRPVQGEKGIGRLALATLGDTVLLLTRSHKGADNGRFSALLVNWNIFKNPTLRLSDLEIPTLTFQDSSDLETGVLDDMRQDLQRSLESKEQAYAWEGQKLASLQRDIIAQLSGFKPDLGIIRPTLRAIGEHGTAYVVGNLHSDFRHYIDASGRGSSESPAYVELVQLLGNFRNIFKDGGGLRRKSFSVAVRLWEDETRSFRNILHESEAIEPPDLRVYDHFIDVTFDSQGRYEGTLEVFGTPVKLRPTDAQEPRNLSCGPFALRVWYFQGRKEESRLEPEQWGLIDRKLERFGGLMVYRDSLRVLPYGRPELDWLRFEERRSKGAGRYFFSYRRMFGYVEISARHNPRLTDKAGREGFISNKAYRDFQGTLVQFFADIAAQFFYKEEGFKAQKEKIKKRKARIEAERRRREQERQDVLRDARAGLKFMTEEADQRLKAILTESKAALDNLELLEPAATVPVFERFEGEISRILQRASLLLPSGFAVAPGSRLSILLEEYEQAQNGLIEKAASVRRELYSYIEGRQWGADKATMEKRLLLRAYEQAVGELRDAESKLREAVKRGSDRLSTHVRELSGEERKELATILMRLTSTKSVKEALATTPRDLNEAITELAGFVGSAVRALDAWLERIEGSFSRALSSEKEDLESAQFVEIEALREEVERNLELVQLGLAVEIIDHDLNKLYRGIKGGLKRLRRLVGSAPKSSREVETLAANFQHLEERYRLMSPLYRGSYQQPSEIEGRDLVDYCSRFLSTTLESNKVTLESTAAFSEVHLHEILGIVLPVFVNLVDNSIYWLRNEEHRRILLDFKDGLVTICDTGPGIHESLLETVFRPFFTTKPGGRGLGLYIARANLERRGHEIWATNDPNFRTLKGACLCIKFHEDALE